MNVRTVDQYRSLCVLRVDYIHIPNATHGNLDSRIFGRAINYLDDPPQVDPDAQLACEKKLDARRAEAVDAVRQAIAAGDKNKAWGLLQDLHVAFGPLAEPEFSHYAGCLNDKTLSADCLAKPMGGG
jgi:hypothetical protein